MYVNNCYFKDVRRDRSFFKGWDYLRRKVIGYNVSKSGEERTDMQHSQ